MSTWNIIEDTQISALLFLWLAFGDLINLGVAMNKPHPISYPHVVVNTCLIPACFVLDGQNNFLWVWLWPNHTHIWLIMLIWVLAHHMPNFCLIGLFVSFWLSKQLSVGVAMTNHSYYHIQMQLIMLTQLLGDNMLNFYLVGPLINFW